MLVILPKDDDILPANSRQCFPACKKLDASQRAMNTCRQSQNGVRWGCQFTLLRRELQIPRAIARNFSLIHTFHRQDAPS